MRRENTFRIDFSNLPLKPSYEKIYEFCRTVLGLKREDVKRLQCHRGESCAFVKVVDFALAQKVVDEHDEKHDIEYGDKKYKLRITMEDGSVEVRVWDLPEDVSEDKITEFLSRYGDVLSIRELMFDEGHAYGGIPLGIWSARMVVKRNIESWATIDGVQAYLTYKGQLQSCRHCHEQTHTGISCVQNKKLLVQKSYANVVKQAGPQQEKQQKPQNPLLSKQSVSKPPKIKPARPKSAAPLPASSDVTAGLSPKLPQPSSQNELSVPKTNFPSQSTIPSAIQTHTANPLESSHTSLELMNTSSHSIELFKKPGTISTRSRTNGNETDESSTSTSSKSSNRGKQIIKKPRREGEDDGKMEHRNQ